MKCKNFPNSMPIERQELLKKELFNTGFVFATKKGEIYRIRYGKGFLKIPMICGTDKGHKGYVVSQFMINKKEHSFKNHHIVWIYFNGFIPEGLQINHIDGIKHHNKLSNLELMTNSENQIHSFKTGLSIKKKEENNPLSKLTWNIVKEIRANYVPNSKDNNGYALAKKHNVSKSTIYRVVNNKNWEKQ